MIFDGGRKIDRQRARSLSEQMEGSPEKAEGRGMRSVGLPLMVTYGTREPRS